MMILGASRCVSSYAVDEGGAGGEDRTPDLRFTKPLHYRCATPAQTVISAASSELQGVAECALPSHVGGACTGQAIHSAPTCLLPERLLADSGRIIRHCIQSKISIVAAAYLPLTRRL